jgi:hypothetical protein
MGSLRCLALATVFAAAPLASGLASEAQEKVLFLIVEDDSRVVASNALLGRFDDLKIGAKEHIDQYQVAEAVAVVVTNERLVAYGAHSPGWKEERLRAGESVEGVEVSDSSAQVTTDERLLNFYGKRGTWSVTRRAFDKF